MLTQSFKPVILWPRSSSTLRRAPFKRPVPWGTALQQSPANCQNTANTFPEPVCLERVYRLSAWLTHSCNGARLWLCQQYLVFLCRLPSKDYPCPVFIASSLQLSHRKWFTQREETADKQQHEKSQNLKTTAPEFKNLRVSHIFSSKERLFSSHQQQQQQQQQHQHHHQRQQKLGWCLSSLQTPKGWKLGFGFELFFRLFAAPCLSSLTQNCWGQSFNFSIYRW